MGRPMVWLGFVLVGAAANADDIYLRSGGKLTGVIVSQTAAAVEIEVGAGRVTMPRSLVERIIVGESALSVYQARVRTLSPTDASGWLELADWARRADLSGQAREAYKRVLARDADNAVARAALGYRRVADQWMTHDEAMSAQGYVRFEGEWVTSVQRDLMLAEREASRREHAEAARARAAVAEAEARAREAEARARAAEAEARLAEDERDRASFGIGAGLWGYPGTFVVAPSHCCSHWRSHSAGSCPHRRSTFGSFGSTFGFSYTTRPAPPPIAPEPTRRHRPGSSGHVGKRHP